MSTTKVTDNLRDTTALDATKLTGTINNARISLDEAEIPNLGTAILAGGMLAFALSFDEVIVTTFTAGQQTTLPIWMLTELIRPRQRPVTNVVAVFIICITFIPILIAYYLTRDYDSADSTGK